MRDSEHLPTGAIQNRLVAEDGLWFEYPVRAHPHHTDYGGVVWHGQYIAWMEEARVECLRSIGIDYADLVALGCELLVVELSTRYHRAMRLGETAIVRTSMEPGAGVRLNWDYQIVPMEGGDPFLSARITLVTVDREKGKIMRRLPPVLDEVFAKLSQPSS
ncbi:acyl-CoA thioesterase [Geitlerinema sp. P-1104]|uniref:acyl-CoA thioesterase n=1 Tax=Geitlerinema sp. P-1104 TaxID=2546230 RepID=UPI0014778475|nr:thioesterase family protein [Geitlerinema sp. P-1104]NMG58709.1 acyl-CoA thioesterase [Geitlerinema sp. P-1104]